MIAKNKQICSVTILVLIFGINFLLLPVDAATKTIKLKRWQPRFIQRPYVRSRSAGAHLYASSSAVQDAIKGRSAEAGSTGRDLFKKLQMFKSLYQQPHQQQQNITVVVNQTATPTTTTITTPTTTTTTTIPTNTNTNTNTNTGTTTRIATLPAGITLPMGARDDNINADAGGFGYGNFAGFTGNNMAGSAVDIANGRRQQHPVNRVNKKRLGVKKYVNFNVPPIRRKPQVGGIGGGGGGVNGFGQQSNRRKVQIITKRKKNNMNKKKKNKNRIANNKNKNNQNNNNNYNSNPSPNRFQNIMNAFRLQTPVVYNY